MTYHAAPYRSGIPLYLTALMTVSSFAFALVFLATVLLSAMHNPMVREVGEIAVIGLVVAGPLAIAMSLFVRCHACDKLLMPLVYDGKTPFASHGPSAFAIGGAAFGIVMRGRAACPHCGTEAQV